MKIGVIIFIIIAGIASVYAIGRSPKPSLARTHDPAAIRYLPLGDSYTIGQSVRESERWPNQLTDRARASGIHLSIVANPAVTGYTTQDLIEKELPLVPRYHPDFVTVLIGVNDYVQGVDPIAFTRNLNYILDSLQSNITKPKHIILVTIPDYGLTPTGGRFGPPEVSRVGVEKFNGIIREAASAHNLAVADIFSVSQTVVKDPTLTASDGLHPSGKQYKLWTEVIYKTILDAQLFRLNAPKP